MKTFFGTGIREAVTTMSGVLFTSVVAAVASPAASGSVREAEKPLPPPFCELKKGDRVVFAGDSITENGITAEGFQTLLKAHLKSKHPDLGVEIVNAGFTGDKVTDLQARFDKDVLRLKPTVVAIYAGINDVWRGQEGTTRERYEEGLTDLVKRGGKAGARVFLCTPSVIGERKPGSNRFDAQLDEYAEVVRKVAGANKLPLLDLRRAFVRHLEANNLKDSPEGVLTLDGVHMNAAGNRFLADQFAALFGLASLGELRPAEEKPVAVEDRKLGAKWIFRDGDVLYWNGSSHSQDEGWQASVIEFYLRTRFPEWKISSGRGGPTGADATAFREVIAKLKPSVIFCEFGLYGGDGDPGPLEKLEKWMGGTLQVCRDNKVTLVMMPTVYHADHIDRLPAIYKDARTKEDLAAINDVLRKEGTYGKPNWGSVAVDIDREKKYWRMPGGPGCDKRVALMQAWGEKVGVPVPRTYEDQRDWLLKVWESDPGFPWGNMHPPKPGYLAIGYYLLERMEAPVKESSLSIDCGGATPAVKEARQCAVSELVKTEAGIHFKRKDEVLPVVPPVKRGLIPREPCPVLKYSPYFLKVTGLPEGSYEILVEKVVLGTATQAELAAGVNLNSVFISSGGNAKPPWLPLWDGCRRKQMHDDAVDSPQGAVGKAAWLWEVRPVKGKGL
ncbi:MAG: hypothetical protein C0404_04240 [Verrucomicrobia bacterium]|nr:hypothetical protein [Verrucomicrobiota bacterium]